MESLPSGIQYRHWPVDDAKACVLLAHGLAEHTGRYEHVAARFNERGVAVVGPDHIGHGASPGVRVYLKASPSISNRCRHSAPTLMTGTQDDRCS